MIARGYGLTAYTARNAGELKVALEEAKQTDNSVLIDIKVLPKSMTDGYDSWWHVGIGDSKTNEKIKAAYDDRIQHLKDARMY
jgi:3D-(3,5/4)-trihydroxycyclohexane-1,2-dione acylhydrolase (decyclizing)